MKRFNLVETFPTRNGWKVRVVEGKNLLWLSSVNEIKFSADRNYAAALTKATALKRAAALEEMEA